MTTEIKWNIPEYEIEKLARFLLPQIQKDFEEQKKNEQNDKRQGQRPALTLSKNKENPKQLPKITSFGLFCPGGDGGNRNRVRRRIAKGSTSVVYRLRFPSRIGDKQPIRYGSF